MSHWRVPVGRTGSMDRIVEIVFDAFAFGIATAFVAVSVIWRIVAFAWQFRQLFVGCFNALARNKQTVR
jgi:hypothetical protein